LRWLVIITLFRLGGCWCSCLYGRHWWGFTLYTRWWHYETFVVVV